MTTIRAFKSIVTILTAFVTIASTISATTTTDTTASSTTTGISPTSDPIAFTLGTLPSHFSRECTQSEGYGSGGTRYSGGGGRAVVAMVVMFEVVVAVSTSVVKTITIHANAPIMSSLVQQQQQQQQHAQKKKLGCSHGDNGCNPIEFQYRGVRKRPKVKYGADITNPIQKVRVLLGTFDTKEEATRAYNKAARMYRGPKAKLNFPTSNEDNIENLIK
ncbi:hypothetical protein KY290_026641 [Solanum tuberosum]|uniref:AP2/ERF domain-containing protein n=1 Tax=Solanum tuberosum TaxID=4113 RepID=A0ABQ7UX17_SOLTU|nr:hypothetical protein KY290_026641 [Solanum tuberosum]